MINLNVKSLERKNNNEMLICIKQDILVMSRKKIKLGWFWGKRAIKFYCKKICDFRIIWVVKLYKLTQNLAKCIKASVGKGEKERWTEWKSRSEPSCKGLPSPGRRLRPFCGRLVPDRVPACEAPGQDSERRETLRDRGLESEYYLQYISIKNISNNFK